jgi:hypothetical protein
VAEVAISKTYLRGLADVFKAVGGSGQHSERQISNMLSSFIPYTSLVGAIERQVDPTMRETQNPWEAIEAKLAGVSDKLPPAMNLWGDDRSSSSDLGMDFNWDPDVQRKITMADDLLNPLKNKKIQANAVDTEIMRLSPLATADNVDGSPPTRIPKRATFDGVQVNFKQHPKVYVEYVKLAGNELKDPAFDKGCKEFLEDVITGGSPVSSVYRDVMQDPARIKFINSTVMNYRKMAQAALMDEDQYPEPEFGEFRAMVRQIKQAKAASQLPQGAE